MLPPHRSREGGNPCASRKGNATGWRGFWIPARLRHEKRRVGPGQRNPSLLAASYVDAMAGDCVTFFWRRNRHSIASIAISVEGKHGTFGYYWTLSAADRFRLETIEPVASRRRRPCRAAGGGAAGGLRHRGGEGRRAVGGRAERHCDGDVRGKAYPRSERPTRGGDARSNGNLCSGASAGDACARPGPGANDGPGGRSVARRRAGRYAPAGGDFPRWKGISNFPTSSRPPTSPARFR